MYLAVLEYADKGCLQVRRAATAAILPAACCLPPKCRWPAATASNLAWCFLNLLPATKTAISTKISQVTHRITRSTTHSTGRHRSRLAARGAIFQPRTERARGAHDRARGKGRRSPSQLRLLPWHAGCCLGRLWRTARKAGRGSLCLKRMLL